MRVTTLIGLLTLGAQHTYGQVSSWGQCGGVGYTGATTCVTGYYCSYSSTYYSQCIPGTGGSSASSLSIKTSSSSSVKASSSSSAKTSSSSSVKASSSSTGHISSSSSSSVASTTVVSACTAAFTPIGASAAVAGLNPGWNLGNTLDATPDEGSWGNPPVQLSTFANIRAWGYNSVRIPVTWADHFTTSSPTWTVNSTWLQRVETVVDEALSLGFYVIVNVHHDSWMWADPSAAGANVTMIEEKFGRLWSQIGKQLACKSSKLIFEPLNEPSGSTEAHADVLNTLNGIFLQSINQAGGNNPQRVVSLSGLGMNSDETSQWFKRPTTYPNQPWALQFHYYSPYSFIFNAWGNTIWGSAADKATIQADFQNFKNNFTDIPTFIGEWDASVLSLPVEQAARWKYIDYFVRLSHTFGYSTIIWDNGQDQYNRTSNTWYDPIDQSILTNAAAGTSNSLADSTTDPSATSQSTSADLFHRVGDPVIAQSVPYLLNGNTLKSIKNSAGVAIATSSYSISSTGSLTFTSAYLGTLYSSTSAAGVKDTLTLTFSAGSPLTLKIVQYDTPVIPQTSYKINTAADLSIPVTYKGLPQVAAVKAVLADGTYLADSWTVYLGPLQQARWTWSSWEYDSRNLIIKQSGSQAIQTAGQSVTLTVEFFPRSVGQNSVNITLTQ